MMIVEFQDVIAEVEGEMNHAIAARQDGKEGRARVCARRAAGGAVAIFYQQRTGEKPRMNHYRLLRWIQNVEAVPAALKEAAARLTVRVTPEYKLPHSNDPLQDARTLITALLFADENKLK